MTTHALTLREPHELLAIVPFVLGFHPTNSIVVLCLHGRRLGLTQRLDLPHPPSWGFRNCNDFDDEDDR